MSETSVRQRRLGLSVEVMTTLTQWSFISFSSSYQCAVCCEALTRCCLQSHTIPLLLQCTSVYEGKAQVKCLQYMQKTRTLKSGDRSRSQEVSKPIFDGLGHKTSGLVNISAEKEQSLHWPWQTMAMLSATTPPGT